MNETAPEFGEITVCNSIPTMTRMNYEFYKVGDVSKKREFIGA